MKQQLKHSPSIWNIAAVALIFWLLFIASVSAHADQQDDRDTGAKLVRMYHVDDTNKQFVMGYVFGTLETLWKYGAPPACMPTEEISNSALVEGIMDEMAKPENAWVRHQKIEAAISAAYTLHFCSSR